MASFSALATLKRPADLADARRRSAVAAAERRARAEAEAQAERAEAAAERERARDSARKRPLPPERISPITLLVDRALAHRIAASPWRLLDRRGLMFLAAVAGRGRGRLPKALRAEAERLNRAEWLLAMLRAPDT